MLIPEAAICRANSLPIPDEAPVTSAQGPNLFYRVLHSSFCSVLPAYDRHTPIEAGNIARTPNAIHPITSSCREVSFDLSLISAGRRETGIRLKLGVNYAPNSNLVSLR